MKHFKNSFLLISLVLSVLVLSAFASAASLTITPTTIPSSLKHDQGSFTVVFDLTNVGKASTLDWSGSKLTSGSGSIDTPDVSTIAENESITGLQALISFDAGQSGTIAGVIAVKPLDGGATRNFTFNIAINSSSTMVLTKTQELTETQPGVIELKNTGNTDLSNIVLADGGAFDVTFSDNNIDLAKGQKKFVTVSSVQNLTLKFGSHPVTVNATEKAHNVYQEVTFSAAGSFCEAGPAGKNLSISSVSLNSDGDDDNDWKRLDTIDVKVKVENIGDNRISNVIVEMGLFDSSGVDQASDLDFTSEDDEKVSLGSLNDGDEDTITFTFKVPADFDTGDYKLALKAYSSGKEERDCTDTSDDLNNNQYEEVNVDTESDEDKFIIVDNIELPQDASCGEIVSGSFDVFNVGDNDEDQVLVTLVNKDLSLDKEFEIRNNLDEGDDQNIDFTVEVPSSAKDGTYILKFKTFYDFRSNSYHQESQDTFEASLKVIGCSTTNNNNGDQVSISAQLASDAKAGQELVVNSVIANIGTSTLTITVDATGYQSWASLESISKQVISLAPGQSTPVTFKFNVNEDVSESENFFIQTRTATGIETQEIEVSFPGTNTDVGFEFPQLPGSGLIWVIALVNIVLIILIIVVAARLARK